MATAIPVTTSWIPEDDLLLKNAVEAGASLESLAKGAVQFSRRFTFRELRDRWHSLLFDPDISAQASIRMFELELSGFNPLSRNNRSDHSKASREVPEKRKIVSIRNQYYSMRKKFRSEFFNPTDFGFLGEPNLHESSGHVADFHGFDRDLQDSNCVLGNSIHNRFEFQEGEIEILRSAFSKPTGNTSVTSGAVSTHTSYLTGCSNTLEDKQPNGMLRTYGFAEDVSTPLREDGTPIELNVKPSVMSSFIEGNSVNFGEHSGVQEPGVPQMPSDRKLLESLEMQQLSVFDTRKEHPQNVLRGSRQERDLNSTGGNSSFNTIGFSSADPSLSLWEPVEDFSATPLPVSLKQRDATQDAEKMLTDDGASNGKNSSVYNAVDSGPLLGVSEGEFGDLSDSLLNFSNEDDILLIDVDGKETLDKSYSDNVNLLLLSSPNDAQEDSFNNLEPEALVISERCLTDPRCADLERSGAIASSIHDKGHQNVHHPKLNEPSTSTLTSDSHALGDGNICCTLNTEDPEIPCNDDIFLLIHPSTSFTPPAVQATPMGTMDLSSAASPEQTGQENLMMDAKDPPISSTWSQKIAPNVLPETCSTRPLLGFGVKSELSDTNSATFLARDAKKALGDLNHSRSLHANPSISSSRMLEDDISRVDSKAGETPVAFLEAHNTLAGSVKIDISESMVNPSTSDQEESQSDNDVPYFSDVEAMILEMDLDPHNQDSHCTKQVSRYQYEDTKRAIIRLEQCAQSYLQRSMTSQGALAVFYGRHLRHYIRKTEVILGRSTDDVHVDIDLRKEGRANQISRRQAIVKMEGNGSFYLKNLGKSLISVNGKSVASGQLICLGFSCLIEIRGMSFVFEINQKYVRHYINIMSQKSQEKNSKFEWSPKEET